MSALTEFAQLADDREREIALTYLLQRSASPRPVPILFRRIEAGRDCGLFYNPDTKRFYVRLFIVSPHSHLGRRLTVVGRYVDVRTGTLYMRDEDAHYWHGIVGFGRAKTSVFVPLELGRYHEEALRYTETAFLPQRQRAHAPEAAAPVCAWLVKREERYQLHVTFRIRTPAYQATRTLLGVDRGLSSIAAGAVISGDGYQVLGTVRVGGEELDSRVREIERETAIRQARGEVVRDGARRTRIADDHIHRCANQVVELARRHCSQVIMEDLAIFSPAHRPQRKPYHPRTNFNAMLSRRQYQKLLHFVDAKLALVGLPPVRRVSPAYTSQTCSICGHVDRPQHLQLFYSRQVASGLSQSTVHHIHGMLHRALKDALLMGLVQRNVCEMVRGPRRSTREMIALSEEQARRLLELVKDDRYEALYLLALTTAMREGELLGLRWQDVDLGKATLQVRMNVQEADG